MRSLPRIAGSAIVLVLLATGSVQAAEAPRPHIVHIVSDDQGWKDIGYHGSDIRTPNLDALARGGMRLEQFYAQPMCTPTRAALMTGRYPLRYGLQTAVIASGQTYGLATDERLLPEALKEAGYETAIIGKWHLGHSDPKYWPRQRGFDYQYGPLIGEIDHFTHEQHHVLDWYRDNKPVREEGYSTVLLGNDAVKRISEHDPKVPLYLYLTFNAPHTPYQAPQEYLDRYAHVGDPSRRAYAAMLSAIDDQVGRVVEALGKNGMRKDTLIVYQSDNGGTSNPLFAGEGDMSKIRIPVDNGPYRDGKASVYEGGTRVVAFANWPGHVRAGGETREIVHVVDLFPTFANLAGAPTSKGKPLDGLDAWGTISEGRTSARTEVVYNIEPFRAGIRQGDWKLVWRALLPESEELYDIARDPYEKNDVAASHPEIVARLRKRANEIASTMAKPLFLQTEFDALRVRMGTPPALPGQELYFDTGD